MGVGREGLDADFRAILPRKKPRLSANTGTMSTNVNAGTVARQSPRSTVDLESDHPIPEREQFLAGRGPAIPTRQLGAPRLRWRRSDHSLQTIEINRVLTLGHDPGCDVVLPYPWVAPVQCLVGSYAGGFALVALDPTFTTRLNGTRLEQSVAQLADNDRIELGGEPVVFQE